MRAATIRTAVCSFVAVVALSVPFALAPDTPALAQNGSGKAPLYNTAKQKLLDGKQINGHTVSRPDAQAYCEAAPHYDYTWFEMQHSTLSWADIERMTATCPHTGVPMVRIHDELESSLQHATDIGLIGIIMPTVDTPEKAMQTVRFCKYPPFGRRSQGGGQAGRIWGINGINYRQTINDNMLVVVMIETPVGVANAYEIARVPGVDVVITGNSDLTNFSGYRPGDPHYEQMLVDVRDAVHRAGKIFGTAAETYRSGHPLSKDVKFTQNGPPNDGWTPPGGGGKKGGKKGGQ
jgi:2-keto-3-deoxy-L-rhamnonate aldolase RhmA